MGQEFPMTYFVLPILKIIFTSFIHQKSQPKITFICNLNAYNAHLTAIAPLSPACWRFFQGLSKCYHIIWWVICCQRTWTLLGILQTLKCQMTQVTTVTIFRRPSACLPTCWTTSQVSSVMSSKPAQLFPVNCCIKHHQAKLMLALFQSMQYHHLRATCRATWGFSIYRYDRFGEGSEPTSTPRPTFAPPSKTYFKTLRICLCPPLHPNQPRQQQLSLRRYNDRSFHGNQKNGRSTVQPQRTGGVPRPCNCGPKSDGAAVGHIFSRCFLCFFVGLKFGKKPVLACIISKSTFETPWCSPVFLGCSEGPSQVHKCSCCNCSSKPWKQDPWLWP